MSATDGNMTVGNSSGNAWDDYIRRGFEVGAGTCIGQVSAPPIDFSQTGDPNNIRLTNNIMSRAGLV